MATLIAALMEAASDIPEALRGYIADVLLTMGTPEKEAHTAKVKAVKHMPKKANKAKPHPVGRKERVLSFRKDGDAPFRCRCEWCLPKQPGTRYNRHIDEWHQQDIDDALYGDIAARLQADFEMHHEEIRARKLAEAHPLNTMPIGPYFVDWSELLFLSPEVFAEVVIEYYLQWAAMNIINLNFNCAPDMPFEHEMRFLIHALEHIL